jgi:F-type H+-transporting ATPase subunit b
MATETHESRGLPETAAHAKPKLLQFDPGIGIWTLIAFVLLLVLLKKFAWKPILASIDERDKKIKESLNAANQLSQDSKKQSEEQSRILGESQKQAALLLGEARKSAEVLKDQILESAQKEKDKMLQTAHDDISSLTAQAKTEIRIYSAELAIKTAEKILVDQLDHDRAKKLSEKLVQEFRP